MYIVKNTVTGKIHKEPARARRGYGPHHYKTERAAKAAITRTLKYYERAIQQVADVVAEGKPEYAAPLYNAYRDATDPHLGREWVNNPDTYTVMTLEHYGDPQVTRTGRSPYTGKMITVTLGINEVGTHMDPLCESHYTN